MNRDQKINRLLEREADDTRRLALDEEDAHAREANNWGSKEHRDARDKTEKTWDAARRTLEALSDDQLDAALARTAPVEPSSS